jgi:hypothetical protein
LANEYLFFRNTNVYSDLQKWQEPREVDYIIGAFMLIKRQVIEKAGLLDEDYFFGVEDVEYCKKVHDQGFPVFYDPRVSAIHLEGRSHYNKWFDDPYLHKHKILYAFKHYNRLEAYLSWLVINVGLAYRHFLWRTRCLFR